ncbi:MAG: tRNA (adenosine(37)-N6)-threonylcarbamoyltransferase complex ATPase subunit type 1 TsaE [Planctomycetota bacterium]|jgi:tRNA threonylcarbamoyladenosine biosynthesis protein TsaE
MAREVVTRSPEETRSLGRRIGEDLLPGDVLLLEGELGTGKTTFVKGIADACGVTSMVRSPTFAMMHRYRGHPDLVHVDLYREQEAVGLEDLDLDACAAEVITVVEWPRQLAAYLWPDAPRLRFAHVDETRRRIMVP